MNKWDKVKVRWKHFKIRLFEDKEFRANGCKVIPCLNCGKEFKSYIHYRDMSEVYDSVCDVCEIKMNGELK